MSPTSPREGTETVAGIGWMARMIDKARLDAQGELAQFDLVYPCPMDRRLLEQLGIDGPAFQQVVLANETDEAIVAELQSRNLLPA